MRVRALFLAVLVLALFPVTASADYPHVVAPGETLTSVAAVDGLSVDAIAAANGLSDQSELIAGQILWIPPRTFGTAESAPTTASSNTEEPDASTSDSDADGDTDVSTATSTAAGQASQSENTSYTRSASSSSSPATTTSQPATSSTATPSTATSSSFSGAAPQPTAERVSASQIGYVAAQYGVPAAFAEAVAWQESGWNNAEVSDAGAIGVMQIVPSTWDWIDRYLTPSSPLGTDSASENIRAGVLLLHELLLQTGGSEQLAAAGYFQGLASVRAHGMYAGTRQYVADVLALTAQFGG